MPEAFDEQPLAWLDSIEDDSRHRKTDDDAIVAVVDQLIALSPPLKELSQSELWHPSNIGFVLRLDRATGFWELKGDLQQQMKVDASTRRQERERDATWNLGDAVRVEMLIAEVPDVLISAALLKMHDTMRRLFTRGIVRSHYAQVVNEEEMLDAELVGVRALYSHVYGKLLQGVVHTTFDMTQSPASHLFWGLKKASL